MTGKYRRQCSCTDCLHTMGLQQMSSEHLHAKSSRIDQLYYSEQLSLRESKLHDKFIRRKAVYNYNRNEIFTGTETIVYNARYAKNHYGEMDDGDKRQKHSSFCTCLGDEGEIEQDPRDPYFKAEDELNDCRICCSCSTTQPQRYADVIKNRQINAKRKQGDRSRKMRAVHFNTKYIRSEPCTCTIHFNESVNKTHSRLNRKKFSNVESIPTTIESKAIKAKRCVCECNIVRKPNKSLQRLKIAKEKVKESIRNSISKIENSFKIRKDSIMLFRDKLMRKRAMQKYECEPYYCLPEYSPPKCHERIKMQLNDFKSEIKRSFHDLRSITSGISFKTRPKKEKSVSKRKSKPLACECEPEVETAGPVEIGFENIDKFDENAFSSKKNESLSVKKNGLAIYIEPTVLSKKHTTKSPLTVKPKSPKHICECDKKEKRRKKSVLSRKSFTKTKSPFEYERYALDKKFPKECEASMCIPGNCDFRRCAEILQAKSQPQDTSEYSSTHFYQRSGGEAVLKKSKHIQTRVKNEHHAKSENLDAKRQAVRIGSNFSFNIEFYKEQKRTEKGGEPPKQIRKQKPRANKSVSSKTMYSNCQKVFNRNKSVQSEIKRFRSIKTNSLKRCFCTLRLKDAPKSKKSSQSLKSKQIQPQLIIGCDCETKQKKNTQTVKYKQLIDSPTTSLAPLEGICMCDTYFDSDKNRYFLSREKRFEERFSQNKNKRSETENKLRTNTKRKMPPKKHANKESNNICQCNTTTQTPGQVANVTSPVLPSFSTPTKCNDYTCKGNIKQNYHVNGPKNKTNYSKFRTKSVNTLTDTGSSKRQMSLKSNNTLPDTGSSKRQMSCQNRTLKSLSSKYFAPYGQEISPHRHVVRIGSSFSFNVEFYKDTNSEKGTLTTIDKGDGRNNNHKNKERLCQAIDIPYLHQPNNETKESYIKPFLDKCFCTLKLRKGKKDTIRVLNQKLQSKANTRDLKSRDCQCEIKRSTYNSSQKTKQSMAKVSYKSASSGTSKSYFKSKKNQAQKFTKPDSKCEKRISRNTVSFENLTMNENAESNKRVVRLGSSFSFNVEFFKEKGDAPSYNEIQPVFIDQRRKTIKTRDKKYEDEIIPMYSQKQKYCKKALTHLPDDAAKTLSLRCKKHNKIDNQEINTPKSKIKSHNTKSKKKNIKKLLENCKCDRTIKERQKSFKQISYRANTSAPETMKLEIIGKDMIPVKYKTQKTQSNFYKTHVKDKYMKPSKSAMKAPTEQLVQISSNFGFNTEFGKEHTKPLLKKQDPKLNDLKIKDINKPETKRNNLKGRQNMFLNKHRKSSNLGILLKHCLCSLKHLKQTKNEKMINDNEKETQLNLPIPPKCQRYMCEKYVTANRKQPKAKSVLDLKGPYLKTKKVQSTFKEHEPYPQKYSDQNIKPEKTRIKHRQQNSSSKKAVCLGSAFKFDIEFYKEYESPDCQKNKSSFKKHRRDTKNNNLNGGLKDEIYTDKTIDKRLYGSSFQKHREYQVGYMKEEVAAMPGKLFQQNHLIWHMRTEDEHLKKTAQIVNPVLIQSNPCKKSYTKSIINGKGKKKSKWRKKRVKFAVSNIETTMNNNSSFKPLNKNKRFWSEIYDTCFCDSYEVLQPKRSVLRATSHAFSSSTKMPKERFNLQSNEKISKLIETALSKNIFFCRKVFSSKHRKHGIKSKSTQIEVKSLNKTSSCCIYNTNTLKEKRKDSNWARYEKTICNPSLRKSSITNVGEVLQHKNYVKLKRRNRQKKWKKISKPQNVQQVFHVKNIIEKNPLTNTYKNYTEHSKMSYFKEKVHKNEERGRHSTQLKTNDVVINKRSRTIKTIMKSHPFPSTRRASRNYFSHIRDRNPSHKAGKEKYATGICKTVMIETIMPYSKKNFRQSCSRTCLTKECKLLIRTTDKNNDKAKNLDINRAISQSEVVYKKTTLHYLSQKFRRKTVTCHDICLKEAKTNLLDNLPSQRVKKASLAKQIVRKNRSVENIYTNVGNLSMKKTCCVCCKLYSDTDTDKVEPKAQDEPNLSKKRYKLTVKDKPSTHEPRGDNVSKGNFRNKILNYLKESNIETNTPCECGSKICKSKSKLSLTPSIEPNVICLCHHECKCSGTLKKAKKKVPKKKAKKKNKQITKKQQFKNQTTKIENAKLTKMYSLTPDRLLLAESVLDVTKMSAELICNLIKFPFQVISDRRSSCDNFKLGMRKPANRAVDIQQKICAMRVTKNFKDVLKSWTVTSYLIHAFDDDPEKRLKAIKSKKRMKKRKERMDFGCSPFMASLRKRPFLWVYDKCPSMYPQFISLLAGWRQFIDVLLFLAAIVVWSPCIVGIEMCRAIMCCCFCTG